MISIRKEPLMGTLDDIRAKLEKLASDQDHHEYRAGTRLRELAVKMAQHDGLAVSVAVYEDASQELEVALKSALWCGPIVISRSDDGDSCHIELERWLPVSGQDGVENSIKNAVELVHSILIASVSIHEVKGKGI